LVSWFDLAYATFNIVIMIYCFRNYFLSKKMPFLLFGLGFTCLLISDFFWVFTLIPWSQSIVIVYGYVRLGLYTAFIALVLRALQLFNANLKVKTK